MTVSERERAKAAMEAATGESPSPEVLETRKASAKDWFVSLRDSICAAFEAIEDEAPEDVAAYAGLVPGRFTRTAWDRENQDGSPGGGGVMGVMKGRVFEKVGVNVSTVHGAFSPQFAKEIPGAAEDPRFWASGISLVAHMRSPKVPAVHMNTRFICTTRGWFGGGSDLNPPIPNDDDSQAFHAAFKAACDAHDPECYEGYKTWCDEYFYIPHRHRARGIGGVFFDYKDTGDWEKDFAFTQDIGKAFLDIYPKLVRRRMAETWTEEDRETQLIYRGLYAEFNLLYDRGTRFGLMTGGNPEAILMSLPPEAKWP